MNSFSKIKFEHWMIVFSVIGIFALYIISLYSQPVDIRLNEIASYDGREISTQGFVLSKYVTKTGTIFDISENNCTVTIFVGECAKEIGLGDYVKVVGRVQKYKDKFEIMILNDDKITILKNANNIMNVIQGLAENPHANLNSTISAFGFVKYEPTRYNNRTTFYLTDDETKGRYSIRTTFNNDSDIHKGDGIVLVGMFSYDEQNSRYYIDCQSLEVKHIHGVWKVSIAELAGYPSSYENAVVDVSGVVQEINATQIRLTDEKSRYNLSITFTNNTIVPANLSIGVKLFVEGTFAYNETTLSYIIIGSSINKVGA